MEYPPSAIPRIAELRRLPWKKLAEGLFLRSVWRRQQRQRLCRRGSRGPKRSDQTPRAVSGRLSMADWTPFAKRLITGIDPALAPLTYLAGLWLKGMRSAGGDGFHRLPRGRRMLRKIGLYPLRDHYHEPFYAPDQLHRPLGVDRNLAGIDLNVDGQLQMLHAFGFEEELNSLPLTQPGDRLKYYYDNGYFESGDAEFFYCMIRHFKPQTLVEIGSGFSSLMAVEAIVANRLQNPGYACRHVCIEPFERPWLEQLQVELIRTPVERCDKSLFLDMQANDILFIDSSHVIKPQGDVLCEYLEILPVLKPGVFVHIHDIFTPRDYLPEWLIEKNLFWNEQYIVEAFLSFNEKFKIVGALNYLKHHHTAELSAKCPIFARQAETREPGSLWLKRVHY
jgi:Methyltransferase domain